jgi:hypothetical protein
MPAAPSLTPNGGVFDSNAVVHVVADNAQWFCYSWNAVVLPTCDTLADSCGSGTKLGLDKGKTEASLALTESGTLHIRACAQQQGVITTSALFVLRGMVFSKFASLLCSVM